MITKLCSACGKITIHNPCGKGNEPRCTRCAQPYGTGPKRERNEMLAKLAIKGWGKV